MTRPDRPAGVPRVIAHRGASAEAPEHSLAAYRRAVEAGADGLECDVRLTRDGVLVCVHDRRVDRTSDGRGAVAALDLADLAELDFSVRRRRVLNRSPDRRLATMTDQPDATRVLTLERLLELVVDAPRRVELAIETKYPTRSAGRLEAAVADLLRRFELVGAETPTPVRVMSFASASLRRFHAIAPEIPSVLLLPRLQVRLRDGRLPAPIGIAGPSIGLVRRNPWYVARAHDAGHQVYVWTVDAAADVELVASLRVDAIITNRPREVLAMLGGGPA